MKNQSLCIFAVLGLLGSNILSARAVEPTPYRLECKTSYSRYDGSKALPGKTYVAQSKVEAGPDGNVLTALVGPITFNDTKITFSGAALTAAIPSAEHPASLEKTFLTITHQDESGFYATAYGIRYLDMTMTDKNGAAMVVCEALLNR